MGWNFRSPIFFEDTRNQLKQFEQVEIAYEGRGVATPYIDGVAGASVTLPISASGKSVYNLPLVDVNNDFKNGRVFQLLVSDDVGNAGHIHQVTPIFTPLIGGSDQFNTASWQCFSQIFDGGDPTVHKEWHFLEIHYKGTPTIQIFSNQTSIYNAALTASPNGRQKVQINLIGNYGETLRWGVSGTAAGSIYAVKPTFIPLAIGSN